MAGKTLLIISQTFAPDPASVGQHIADAAVEMVRRGHKVRVYTARRGYDDPSVEYPARENYRGVDVRRLRFSSFGKAWMLLRILGTATFMAQSFLLMLFTPNLEGIFFSTSPPLVGLAASIVRLLRRVPIAYWAMDLNPDQLIAMRRIKPRGPAAFVLERINRFILRNADLVVTLDRFMARRLADRVRLGERLLILPPWPHDEYLAPLDCETNPFRQRHGLLDKFVVMYSGNHSPANPLTTILEAAQAMRDDADLLFLFVGGGLAKKDVETFAREHACQNIVSLPYQPMADLRYSLAAADVHLVSMGDNMVGIVHPCKIYGAMAVGRPILYLGPVRSHIADLLAECPFGMHVAHGDIAGAVKAIRHLRQMPAEDRARLGANARELLHRKLTQAMLCRQFCDALERCFAKRP